MSDNKSRIAHIDNVKAIGIMLIIASHVWTAPRLYDSSIFKAWDGLINSFYVPMFFLLSGVFEPSVCDWRKFLARLLKLLKYIVIFSIFGFITYGIISGDWSKNGVLMGTPIWFLFTLFWITLIFGFIKPLRRYSKLIVCALACCGMWLSHNGHSYSYIGQALLCLPFYAVGFYLKDKIKQTKFNLWLCLGSLTVWILALVLFYKPQGVALNMVNQNYVTFYLDAFLGSIVVIELCKLTTSKYLAWYGRNSIVPMMVQMVFIRIFGKIYPVANMYEYYAVAIVACLICGACIPLFRNRYYDIFI